MEDRETARMRKYGESKTTRIMMATVPHVISGLGLRKFRADGFLLTRVYSPRSPLFLSGFNETRMFSTVCNKSSTINYMKLHSPVAAELFHEDRRTDMTKLIVTFRNCANAPKNLQFHVVGTGTVKGQVYT